ncbi:tyrosyl-tRNA synthetase [Aulographum hederae CBS 113979]|uniref:Tyrosine--tRNA ligase n=1 Tax=Aulographum hederae CBS 113979 TaxID=1176131 RepID=A0A6G1GUA4_9PEZI|nr:tyrosyl-tRNA synthetase [Aulographum hederae CBS 113979]
MAGNMSPDDQLKLINNNLAEVLNPEIIEDVIRNQKRPLIIYWGTATTGRPHAGYWVPMLKLAEFLKAGCKLKILLADVHAVLDNLKSSEELVAYRAQYYRFVIRAMLSAIGVPLDQLEFHLGSDFQETKEYIRHQRRLSTVCTLHDAKRAGAEVVKQVDNPLLSGLEYPVMQALDEEYLGVDAQFGGVDQRKIFALAKDILPRVGMKVRAHLMNSMVPGLQGGKMSASDPDSKIDILDDATTVEKKLKKAYAAPKVVDGNGLLSFIEYVLLPASTIKGSEPSFTVSRERDQLEPLVYSDIKQLHKDYESDILTPQLLKQSVTGALAALLAPIQEAFKANPEWQEIEKKAYPPPPPPEKKQKKVKNKGTKHPGGAAAPSAAEKVEQAEGVDGPEEAAQAMDDLKVEK